MKNVRPTLVEARDIIEKMFLERLRQIDALEGPPSDDLLKAFMVILLQLESA